MKPKKQNRIPKQEGEERVELKIITPTEESVIPLKFCVVGGILADGSNYPMGAYLGSLDPIDATISLSHSLRAFIKFLRENDVNGSGRPITLEQAKATVEIALKEAIETEKKNEADNNVSIDEHIWKMKYERKGNSKNGNEK